LAPAILNSRVIRKQNDEFKKIGDHFNSMAEKLQSAHAQIQEQNEQIRKQQELSESLLLNVLPADVAAELKAKGAVDPRYCEDVTILFTDFKGFTASAEAMAADDLVAALHRYFTAFDKIAARYGMEKLKTIGDSYMCVGGLRRTRLRMR
jgi:adenylate cyclase